MASSSGRARGPVASFLPGDAGRGGNASRSEASTPDQRFPRSWRLTQRRQFLAVYENGVRVGSRSFTMFGLPNTVGHPRLGLTVTRKFGNAVRRNRAKRLLREAFRLRRGSLCRPLDLVLNARSSILECKSQELERELVSAFARLSRRIEP